MRKVLIIHAHPEKASFCSSLCNTAKEHFEKAGLELRLSDLHAMGFDPIGDKADFKSLSNPDFFKYQMEQLNAYQNDLFIPEIKAEMEKLEWCNILIFNFPLWWFGLPAILKGWVDRVFAMGFAYGGGKGVYDKGTFPNKKAFLTITTGGPEQAYGNTGKNGELDTILFPIQHGMLYFTGMTVLPPFISFSPARKTKEELHSEIERYKKHLNNLDELSPVYESGASTAH